MAFSPKIDFCLNNNIITFKDITDVYHVSDNPEGWEDASTILGGDVISAYITITDPDGIQEVFEVTSQIPDPVEGIIEFTNEFVFTIDGIFKVDYVVNTVAASYNVCKEKFFYPKVKCCISNLVKNVIKDCSCKEPHKNNIFKDLVKIKAWEKALEQAVCLGDKTSSKKLLSLLETYCKHNPCGCK